MLVEEEQKIIKLLAILYNTVNWQKMRTSKNPHDIFNHRVRAASRRATLYEAISKLSNYFGLQSIPTDAMELVNELRPIEREVLNKLYMEHIAMCMRGIMLAKDLREEKKRKKENNNKNENLLLWKQE